MQALCLKKHFWVCFLLFSLNGALMVPSGLFVDTYCCWVSALIDIYHLLVQVFEKCSLQHRPETRHSGGNVVMACWSSVSVNNVPRTNFILIFLYIFFLPNFVIESLHWSLYSSVFALSDVSMLTNSRAIFQEPFTILKIVGHVVSVVALWFIWVCTLPPGLPSVHDTMDISPGGFIIWKERMIVIVH